MTLTTDEFIRRFLLHVLPNGFHRIRHYGLFANKVRSKHLDRARELLQIPAHKIRIEYFAAMPKLGALDLALLKLENYIDDSNSTKLVEIAQQDLFTSTMKNHDYGLVGGWGYQCREDPYISPDLIDIAMKMNEFCFDGSLSEDSLFSLASDCEGGPRVRDSGAGLVISDKEGNPVLAGICIRFAYYPDQSCHTNDNPILCANVAAVRDEIMELARVMSTA